MTQKEFRRNCNCDECKYMVIKAGLYDDKLICSKSFEVAQDYKDGKDRCRYTTSN